ncbi:MAG: hypothetical protein ACYCXA_13715 [Actinomycetes bacterium]
MGDDPDARYCFDELRQVLGDAYDDGELADVPAPTHWPAIPAGDAATEWEALAAWVETLCARFAHLDHHVIPRCWWHHNEHVEALAALRDHERSSFAATAPATAALDWLRAVRDVATLLKAWTTEAGCGTAHQDPPVPLRSVDRVEWERHVQGDVRRRLEREIDQATTQG